MWGIVVFLFSQQTDTLEHFNFLSPILQCLVQMMKTDTFELGIKNLNSTMRTKTSGIFIYIGWSYKITSSPDPERGKETQKIPNIFLCVHT